MVDDAGSAVHSEHDNTNGDIKHDDAHGGQDDGDDDEHHTQGIDVLTMSRIIVVDFHCLSPC